LVSARAVPFKPINAGAAMAPITARRVSPFGIQSSRLLLFFVSLFGRR
jgi:hypothetical protein